ncbi:MAG TPA: hypothetical protein VK735_15280, partial [Pseudonocardia sp.]|uniref:hypothetical protein n=1 Tax=Pseudonocardia sp. TaxID=60912 RepID=UPI002CB2F8A4
MTIQFEELITRRTKSGKCPVCGRSVRRSASFTATLSPFNKGPSGAPATYDEAMAKLRAQADQWVPDFHHEGCRDLTGWSAR